MTDRSRQSASQLVEAKAVRPADGMRRHQQQEAAGVGDGGALLQTVLACGRAPSGPRSAAGPSRGCAYNKGNAATGSLLALKLPRTGRDTVWISSRCGAGECTVRLIDGD